MFCEVAAWAEILNLFHFVPSDLRFLSEGIDLLKDRQALQRLTEAAEKAKMELSGVQEAWTICEYHVNDRCWSRRQLKKKSGFLRVNPYCLWWLTHAADICRICRPFLGAGKAKISLPFITADASGPKHIEESLSRAKFEQLASKLITRCRQAFWGEISTV